VGPAEEREALSEQLTHEQAVILGAISLLRASRSAAAPGAASPGSPSSRPAGSAATASEWP
jgi:hypothetical protein